MRSRRPSTDRSARRSSCWVGLAVVLGVVAASCTAPPAPTAPVERMDVSTPGVGGNGGCCWVDGYATQSINGRYVMFNSTSDNLVPGDTNGAPVPSMDGLDWFVRDRVGLTTTRVSVDPTGAEFTTADPRSPYAGGLSPNGRFAAFIAGSTPQNLYIWDRLTSSTSLMFSPTLFGYYVQGTLEVSNDGLVVAFPAAAAAGRRAIVYESGVGSSDVGSAENSPVRLSADGRYVAADHYVHDRTLATTSALVTGGSGTDVVIAMGSDARHVLFSTDRVGLLAADTNSADDLYVKDTLTGGYRLASAGGGVNGIAPTGGWALNTFPTGIGIMNLRFALGSISDDGDSVVFTTEVDGVVPADSNGGFDTFVRDMNTGSTTWATASYDPFPLRWSIHSGDVLSGDGSRVVLEGIRSGEAGLWSQPA